jgi:hypothetical protein
MQRIECHLPPQIGQNARLGASCEKASTGFSH